jgi:hypothetical protein
VLLEPQGEADPARACPDLLECRFQFPANERGSYCEQEGQVAYFSQARAEDTWMDKQGISGIIVKVAKWGAS